VERRRTILTFLVTALAGLAVWVLGLELDFRLPLHLTFFGPPLVVLVAALVAAVAGYVSPRYFWLWGLAVVCLRPVAVAFLLFYPAAHAGVIGPNDFVGLAFGEVMFFVSFMILCTVGSAAGAGLRRLRVGQSSSGAHERGGHQVLSELAL
jgi:hypothetical protein